MYAGELHSFMAKKYVDSIPYSQGAIRWSPVGARQKITLTSRMLGYVGGWVLPFWGFSGFPSKMVKTNQGRKQDKTRSTQKKMPEPEVQQLQNVGPTVARWRVPDVIFFLYLSIVFCFGFPILPYALSFYCHFLLRPLHFLFPTCQVRVVRFYQSCLLPPACLPSAHAFRSCLPLLPSASASCLVLVLLVLLVQLRSAIHIVRCRTSTTTIHAQCSLPDLNHDHPRPVFPAGPQPRPSTPSVPSRTSTASIHAKCSLPDLNREYPRQVFPAGPHVGR